MKAVSGGVILLSAWGLGGCFWSSDDPPWEYMPDMAHSVPYDSFARNPALPLGRTLRRPADGTIPRGFLPFSYGPSAAEAERAGRELDSPLAADFRQLARGRRLYETFCAVCHGETGQGNGPLIPKFPPPPTYTSSRVQELPPGHLYHVVTWGSGRMPSYRAQIAPEDRWRVVLYVDQLRQGGGEER